MKSNWKTLLSLVLVLTMVVSPLSSASAYAAEDESAQTTAVEAAPIVALSEESANTEGGNSESEITNSAATESESVTESPSTIKKEEEKPLDSDDKKTEAEKDQQQSSESEEIKENKEDHVKTEESGKTEEKETVNSKEQDEKSESSVASESEKVLPEALAALALMTASDDTGNTGNNAANIQILKEDGTPYKMFKVLDSSVALEGNQIRITFSTESVSYNKLYFGLPSDAEKSPVWEGTPREEGGWNFSFTIAATEGGKQVPLALCKTDGVWSTTKLKMTIPDMGYVEPEEPKDPTPSSEVQLLKADGNEFKMFRVSQSTVTVKGDNIEVFISTDNTGYNKLYLGSKDDEVKEPVISGVEKSNQGWEFTFTIPLEKKGTNIPVCLGSKTGGWYTKADFVLTIPDVKVTDPDPTPTPTPTPTPVPGTELENGVYNAPTVTTNASMFKVVSCQLLSKNGKLTAEIALSGTGYDYLYMGTGEEAATDSSKWIPYTIKDVLINQAGSMESKYVYEIPVSALDTPISVAAHSSSKNLWYDRTITISSEGLTKTGELPAETLADGIYNAPTVTTNASMFKVVNCQLTSKNGKLTAEIALSGTGYDYLYMGTGEKAATDSSKWIPYTIKDVLINQAGSMESKYVYEIPVSALDTPISVAAHSSSKNLWYDRTITISSEGLTKTGDLPTDPTKPTPTPSVTPTPIPTNPETNGGTTKPTGNDGKAENESKYESDLSGSTGAVDSTTGLKDGVYVPDSFTWSGGTGKVSISCNKVTVKNGQAYATIVFSSSSYSYVKANGRKYYATISGNSSSFTIPVALNKNNTIIGMTTKMSAAHEIAYNIYVYLAAAAKADGTGGTNSDVIIGAGQSSNNKLDEEAPQIIGLTYESETKLDYAEYFKLYHYQDGITLLEVDMTKDTVRDPEKLDDEDKAADEDKAKSDSKKDSAKSEEAEEVESKAADAEAEEGTETEAELANEKVAELYMGNVVKYLLVPENAEIPVGLEKEVVVVNLPVDKTYVASEEALSTMDELELLDMIRALGFEKEDCPIDELAEAMEKDEISFAGTYDDVDYKALLKAQCDMSIMPADLLPREEEADEKEADEKDSDSEETLTVEEQTERLQEIAEHCAMLEIPMLIDRSADEETELAQYEWIKVYGVIFGCESKTEKLFNQAVKDAEKRTTNEK